MANAECLGCKFTIVHDSLDKLKSGKISFIEDFPPIGLGDGDEAFYALVHYQAGLGHFLVPKGQNLNAEFPEIKITKVSDVMEASWKGK